MASNITLSQLNSIINQDVEILEQKPVSSLSINQAYIIKNISVLKTKFGRALLVTLFDESANTTFRSFLPKRVTEHLQDDLVDKINLSGSKYTVTYLGQSLPVFKGAKSKSLLKFDIIE